MRSAANRLRPGRGAGLNLVLVVAAWLALAPRGLAQVPEPYTWRNAPMGGGGFVSGLVYHPRQPGLLYARTDVGGVYRWNPGPRVWMPLNDDLGRDDNQLMGALSVGLDPADPARVYIAAGEYTGAWGRGAALLRSSDQGRSWSRTELPFKLGGNEDGRGTGERLQVDPNHGAVLLLGTTRNGLWRSADHGETWGPVSGFSAAEVTLVLFDARSGTADADTPVIYAGVRDPKGATLLRSRDGGKSWAPVPGAPKGLIPHHAALDASGRLFLTYADGLGPNGVTDGAVWSLEPASGVWRDITPVRPGAERFGYAGLALDAQRPGTLMVSTLDRWGAGDDIFRSTDGGGTWTSVGARSQHDSSAAPWLTAYGHGGRGMGHWIADVEIDPFDSGAAAYVTGFGLWMTRALSDSGAVAWRFDNQGLEETVALDLAAPSAGPLLLTALGDVSGYAYAAFDDPAAKGFYAQGGETNRSVDVAQLRPTIAARTADQARTSGYWTRDGGVTWTPFATSPRIDRDAEGRYRESGRVTVSAQGGFFLWALAGQGGFYSADKGRSWTAAQGWPTGKGAVAVADRAVEGVFYVYDPEQGDMLVSVDGGASFQAFARGRPGGGGGPVATPGRMRDLWLPTYEGLFHAAGPEARFKPVKGVQQAFAVALGAAAPGRDDPAIYVWGRIRDTEGLFRSDDGGTRWARINDPSRQFGWIGALAADQRTHGRVYLGTGGRGVMVGEPVAGAPPR